MAEKKAYPLRINAEVLAAAQRWADDELRSLNAQIEYVLRDALRKAGRLRRPGVAEEHDQGPPDCGKRAVEARPRHGRPLGRARRTVGRGGPALPAAADAGSLRQGVAVVPDAGAGARHAGAGAAWCDVA